MSLHRFFVTAAEATGERFSVPGSIVRQVRTVLRLRDGERIVLLTGDGSEAIVRLDGAECVVEERRPAPGEPRHRLVVIQSLLKGDGLEAVVQRGTELGVAAFGLVVAERCIARDLSPRKLERLRAIARESAEQSERAVVPEVAVPVPLAERLVRGAVLLYERESGHRLGMVAPPHTVVIGPEGGFSHAEVAAARAAGMDVVGLGPRILRAPTVAPAVAAAILSRTGDFA
jgi:16S rRNA (uracil1498-N3)-methyltransferase